MACVIGTMQTALTATASLVRFFMNNSLRYQFFLGALLQLRPRHSDGLTLVFSLQEAYQWRNPQETAIFCDGGRKAVTLEDQICRTLYWFRDRLGCLRRASNNVQLASFLKHKLWRISNTRPARIRAKPPDTLQVTDCMQNPRFGARWHA